MKHLSFLLLALVILIIGSGCSVEKRHYRSGYHITRITKKTGPKENSISKKETKPAPHQVSQPGSETVVVPPASEPLATAGDETADFSLMVKRAMLILSPPDSCDVIIMKSGEEVRGNVLEIGADNIRYRKCEHLDGPLYTARKSDVFMIKYKSGRKEVIQSTAPSPATDVPMQKSAPATPAQPRKTLPMAVISFCASILAFFVAGIILGAAGTIFGIAAAVKISQHPDQYKGIGFAILGIILGLIALILTAVYLSTL